MILGVVSKKRREPLRLEHEAGVIGVRRHSADGVFGSGEVEVFFGADGELDVFVHVVLVAVVASLGGCSGASLSCWVGGHSGWLVVDGVG